MDKYCMARLTGFFYHVRQDYLSQMLHNYFPKIRRNTLLWNVFPTDWKKTFGKIIKHFVNQNDMPLFNISYKFGRSIKNTIIQYTISKFQYAW